MFVITNRLEIRYDMIREQLTNVHYNHLFRFIRRT